jgi:hypothetical protein
MTTDGTVLSAWVNAIDSKPQVQKRELFCLSSTACNRTARNRHYCPDLELSIGRNSVRAAFLKVSKERSNLNLNIGRGLLVVTSKLAFDRALSSPSASSEVSSVPSWHSL